MKKKISAILFGLLFLVGFGILIYPTVSNQWNTYRQSQLISNYQSVVQDMTPEDFTVGKGRSLQCDNYPEQLIQ